MAMGFLAQNPSGAEFVVHGILRQLQRWEDDDFQECLLEGAALSLAL